MAIAFSDTTNKNGLIQLCEQYTGLGDGNISGNTILLKQFTRLLNNAYQKIVTAIFESQDDWDWDDIGTTDGTTSSQTTYPVVTAPLVANQRDYPFPLSMKTMKIRRVDISYDGTNFYRAQPWDPQMTNQGIGNDTDVDNRFVESAPRYDLRANSIWIYPRAITGTGTLRIDFLREPIEFSSNNTANTPGIDTAFQPMLALDASIDYCMTNNPSIMQSLMVRYADMEQRLRSYYSRKDEDRAYQLQGQYTNYH